MALQISSSPNLITPALDRSIKNNIARKSGNKHVYGDTYKQRTMWKRICDFVGSTRAVNVVGKAHFESKQYCEAAILRKDHQANKKSQALCRDLTDEEYDEAVWNSSGVQKRLMREDYIRYSPNYYNKDNGHTSRNLWARRFSQLSHVLHGLCEMNAAPTGMTYNVMRNTAAHGVDEKSTKNKLLMFGMLGFIGVATTELLTAIRSLSSNTATFLGQGILNLLIAFPVASSALGLLGFCAGLASQIAVQKHRVNPKQQQELSKDISNNLQKLLSQLKVLKNKPELIQIMAKAMQGKHHLLKKIKSDSLDARGIPHILNSALAAIDPAENDLENMQALKNALGQYLQVDKPTGDSATLWARYRYAKAVTTKESHYVALVSTVDHMEIANPHAKAMKDARRQTEEIAAPALHNVALKALAYPAALLDRVANTRIAPTLRKWASESYQKAQTQKMSDPGRASKNCFKGEYMAKNIHQYGPVTRACIKIAEGMRLFNMNVVLASNANLSRIFNNIALLAHNAVGTSPASRSMCNSLGRFFGGAVLAIIFGTFIPIAADATGSPSTVSTEGNFPVNFSMTNIGILMFLLSTPTLLVQGLAHVAARVEGWKGNINKTVPNGVPAFQFSR
ncbi:hypothetical protein [Limnobacter sp.]|uniref:hypothetical protein n=1 Tax=Limnobacter sp. TaxID=2003368 RepID=UPI00311DC5AA